VDYVNWKKKPLEGPKDSVIVSAIESTVRDFEAQLVTVITDQTRSTGRDKRPLRSGLLRSSPNLRVEILTQTRIGEPLARLRERHFVFIGPSASPFGEDGRDQSLPIDQ
jgi:hypothetical protein